MSLLLGAFAALSGVSAAPAVSSSYGYSALEADLARLETVLAQSNAPSSNVGYLLRSSYDMSSDDVYAVTPGSDLGGFRFQDALLWFQGQVGTFDVFLMADAADSSGYPGLGGNSTPGQLQMKDAWARTRVAEGVNLYMGQFRCPILLSSMTSEGSLSMIDRTVLGQFFDVFQPGAALTADFGGLHLKLAAQNGADGAADELGIVARAEFKIGEGAKDREGALGAEGLDANFGVAYFKDSSDVGGGNEVGSALAVDGYATLNRLSGHFEVVDVDDELGAMLGAMTPVAYTDSATPYSATVGFLISDQWECVARYQDLDDDLSTTLIGGGINYYLAGHAAKWQLNVSRLDDDNDDGLLLQIGLSVGSITR